MGGWCQGAAYNLGAQPRRACGETEAGSARWPRQGKPEPRPQLLQRHWPCSTASLALGWGSPKWGWHLHGMHTAALCAHTHRVTTPVRATHAHTSVHTDRHPCASHQQGNFPAQPHLVPCTLSPHPHTLIPLCTPGVLCTPHTMDTLIPTPHILHAMHTPLPVHAHSMLHVFTLPCTLTPHTMHTLFIPHAHLAMPRTLTPHPACSPCVPTTLNPHHPHSSHIAHTHLTPHAHSPHTHCILTPGCAVTPRSMDAHPHSSHFLYTPRTRTPCDAPLLHTYLVDAQPHHAHSPMPFAH